MKIASRTPDSRLSRIDLGVLAALLVVAVLLAVLLVNSTLVVGSWLDDGVYLVTAKALADGKGYRHLELPGEPYQTKYPILYPLVLSLVWLLFPEFPGNVPAIQILNTLFWAAGSWIAYRLMRRVWGLPWWLPACGVMLAFVNAGTLAVLQTSMSEPLYFLLSMVALTVLASPPSGSETVVRQPGLARGVLNGTLAAAVYLTRSAGVTLVAATLADLLLRRRWKQLMAAVVPIVAGVGGWQVWCLRASADNAAHPAAAAFAYDLDYGSWIAPELGTLAWVVYHNAVLLPLDYLTLLVPPPHTWLTRMLQGDLVERLPLYLCLVFVSGLTILGLASVWRRARAAMHLYLLFYVGLVCIWPMLPMRLLLPILPLLTTLLLAGLHMLVVQVGRLVCWLSAEGSATYVPAAGSPGRPARWSTGRPGSRAALWLVVVLVALVGFKKASLFVRQPGRQSLEDGQRRREELVTLLRSRTPPDAVICATDGGYLHLRTGRKFVPFLPYEDPTPHRYPADRRLSDFGRRATKGMIIADRQLMQKCMMDYLSTAGAGYLVPMKRTTTYGLRFAEFRMTRPRDFRRIGSAQPYTLYQVVPTKR